MKKVVYDSIDLLHKEWGEFREKHDIDADIETLYKLLKYSPNIARNESEILNTIYDSTLLLLDSTPRLDLEQKNRVSYFSYDLCLCEKCQNTCGAHIDKNTQIHISKKFFSEIIKNNSSPLMGILELMFSILHEVIHCIFPELDEESTVKMVKKVWINGMRELRKEK